MFKLLLALHLVLAVFAIGPLVHAATTAGRGLRTGDAVATASSARLLRIYGYTSMLVIASGVALMYTHPSFGTTRRYVDYLPSDHPRAGALSDTWIWLSLVLWVAAIAVLLGFVVPTLEKATTMIGEEQSVVTLTGRVAAAGGVAALMFVVIVVLMVYRPGS